MAKSPNFTLSPKLEKYLELLNKWAKVINLVSPTTLPDAKRRHFLDSVQLIRFIPEGTKTLFDIGSGAGFPGLVIALECPDIQVHLIESDTKKCSFLSTVSRETNTPVIIHNQRIESVDTPSDTKPDVITARALASLAELLDLTSPWWTDNPQITLIFPKGAKAKEEVVEAQKKYGFEVVSHPSVTDENAQILVIGKVKKL